MKKRGQVTIFIVIGLIILLLAGIFFFVKYLSNQDILGKGIIDAEKAKKAQPVQQYVERCIKDVSEAPLITIAKQGGTLEPVNFLYYQQINYFQRYKFIWSYLGWRCLCKW